MNSKAVDYLHFKGFIALFAALFLVLTSSCASRQYSFLVCDQLRGENGFGFITFDSTYVSSNNLRNKWILDSVRNAVSIPLNDTLIILAARLRPSCSISYKLVTRNVLHWRYGVTLILHQCQDYKMLGIK